MTLGPGRPKHSWSRQLRRSFIYVKPYMSKVNELSAAERDDLISILKARFEKNMARHKEVQWPQVPERLDATPQKLSSLLEMENTNGEPDVIAIDSDTG